MNVREYIAYILLGIAIAIIIFMQIQSCKQDSQVGFVTRDTISQAEIDTLQKELAKVKLNLDSLDTRIRNAELGIDVNYNRYINKVKTIKENTYPENIKLLKARLGK